MGHLKIQIIVLIGLAAVRSAVADTIIFNNGDQLTGQVITKTQQTVLFSHEMLGVLTIKQSQLAAVIIDDQVKTESEIGSETDSSPGNMQKQAQDLPGNIRLITALSAGYSTFEMPAKLDHEIHYPSTELSLAAVKDRWQASLNWTTSLINADVSEEEDIGNADRNDLDLTLGYRINNNWSVFAGYKAGKSTINFTPRDGNTVSTDTYQQRGPYIGTGYSWRFDKAGSLNLSMAYAHLDAVNVFRANTDDEEIEEALEFDDLSGRVTGTTSGFSYSAAWTMPLSSNLLFQSKLKINDYQQDIVYDNVTYKDIDETLTRLSVGIAYVY